MKVSDILNEGVEFHACSKEPHEKYGHVIVPHGMRDEEQDCFICNGKGHNKYGDTKETCGYCKGTGKSMETVCDSPELGVSIMQAKTIIEDILGQEYDHAGLVELKDLPAIRSRLIRMINSPTSRSHLHQDPEDNEGDRKMQKKETSGNVTSIGKSGPRVMGPGRTDAMVLNYAKRLLNIVEYAMKHDLVLSWG